MIILSTLSKFYLTLWTSGPYKNKVIVKGFGKTEEIETYFDIITGVVISY